MKVSSDNPSESSFPVERRETEDDQFVGFARRIVRRLGYRASHNIDTLTELAEIARSMEDLLAMAVHGLRSDPDRPASWADIGRALSISRQAAQQRFGGEGVRQAGGQRGDLR